ncbi:universal stress protein [Streptomyces hygroscopicus subsp. hygroscopicus]|uniref:universal stress protein n=1 Tax=Streptomyces sp. KHY 26 TaxID=3097359 RepID=UPI0024A5108A|nr:universal stress protein [Streptomyces hygroscopicus]GLX50407.1 universal stress protein [Streptomyces hygroscopicus subsp. hygroscopicus]
MNNEAAPPARIVVGVDGSEQSKAALRWAVNQAKLVGGAVDAVLAWDLPTPWHGLVPPTRKETGDYEEHMREVLDGAIDEALGPGPGRPVALRTTSVHGHPAAVLLDAAAGADLLVVGNRGRGEFRGTLLGSVGMHCVQHAPCPVVVIRGSDRET